MKRQDFLVAFLVMLLSAAAFAAGYLANDLRESLAAGPNSVPPEQFAMFWEAWDRVGQSFIGDIPGGQQITYGAIRGALSALDDPYTLFVEPAARDQERDSLRGNFGGIGATLQRNEAGEVLLAAIPGNPAEKAGILEGDVLLAVDGRAIPAEMTVEEIAQMIRGEEGTTVILTIRHPGAAEPIDVPIVRAVILLPSVSFRVLPDEPTIGYIQLARFSAESEGEVREAIVAVTQQGVNKIILDLRQNGGGLLDAAVDVSDLFLPAGPVVIEVSRGPEERIFEATDEDAAGDIPLVVLVDEGTASAAEIVAGALQDRGRAILIGRRTFGKGSVQLVYDLSDGSSVHITSARWFTPDRHQIDQVGLLPDIVVETTPEAVADGRDQVLEQAVEYLQAITTG